MDAFEHVIFIFCVIIKLKTGETLRFGMVPDLSFALVLP